MESDQAQGTSRINIASNKLLDPNQITEDHAEELVMSRLELEKSYDLLQQRISGKPDKESFDILRNLIAKEPPLFYFRALLYGILVEQKFAQKYFDLLINLTKDKDELLLQTLTCANMIIIEMYHRLLPSVRQQLLFFFTAGIQNSINRIDNCMLNLLRSLSDGTSYAEHCALHFKLADILNSNRDWLLTLKRNSLLFPVSLLAFSRFICDQQNSSNSNALSNMSDQRRTAPSALCEFILKERFCDVVAALGRDLIIVLMRISKLTQFIPFWRNILYTPESLTPGFTGVARLMSLPYSALIHTAPFRAPVRLWRKLESVFKIRNNQREQIMQLEKFQKTFLIGPDGGSLRAELIRLGFHLPNLIQLGDQLTPTDIRDSQSLILAWLITNAKLGTEMQFCKLMFFWDWMCFDPSSNAYSTESTLLAIKVLQVQQNFALVNSLFDFLYRIAQTFHPPITGSIINSITASLKLLDQREVMQVLNHPRIESSIKESMRNTFPDLYPHNYKKAPVSDTLSEPSLIIDFEAIRNSTNSTTGTSVFLAENECPSFIPSTSGKFFVSEKKEFTTDKKENDLNSLPKKKLKNSDTLLKDEVVTVKSKIDDEIKKKRKNKVSNSKSEEIPSTSTQTISTNTFKPHKVKDKVAKKRKSESEEVAVEDTTSNTDTLELFSNMLKEEFREPVENLNRAVKTNSTDSCELMQTLLNTLTDNDEIEDDDEQLELIAECLIRVFSVYLSQRKFFSTNGGSMKNNDAFDNPFYLLFKSLCQPSYDSRTLLLIAVFMRKRCGPIGYLFLFYIEACERNNTSAIAIFDKFNEHVADKDSNSIAQLIFDLEVCAINEPDMFVHLLPFVFSEEFGIVQEDTHKLDLIRILCENSDPRQMIKMAGEISRDNISIIPTQTFFTKLVNASLSWTSLEQILLWQLFQAEGLTMDWVNASTIIPKLSYLRNAEASMGVILLIKNMESEPDATVLKNLLRAFLIRPPQIDLLTVDAIKNLLQYHKNIPHVANWIGKLMNTSIMNNEFTLTSISQQAPKKKLTVESILSHLDKFRITCINDQKLVESLLSNPLLTEPINLAKKNAKMAELHEKFSEFFAVVEILEDSPTGRHHRKAKSHIKHERERRRSEERESREGTPKKRRKKGSDSDDS